MSEINPYESPQASSSRNTESSTSQLASRGIRLLATIIDSLILTIVYLLPYYFLLFLFFPVLFDPTTVIKPGMPQDQIETTIQANMPSMLVPIAGTLCGMLMYIAMNGYLLAKHGQTIGKRLLGIRVVRSDGSKASFSRLIWLRTVPLWFVVFIPYIGLAISFIDPLFIFRKSRRCLHDELADTIVVVN